MSNRNNNIFVDRCTAKPPSHHFRNQVTLLAAPRDLTSSKHDLIGWGLQDIWGLAKEEQLC